MYYSVLCDECNEVMVETHSDWIEDGEAYEKIIIIKKGGGKYG